MTDNQAAASDNSTGEGAENNHESVINDSALEASWRDSLPEDIRHDASMLKFDEMPAMAKSYINMQNLIGRDKIPMPQSETEYMDVYKRLGMPEAIEGYEFSDIEFPEGMKKPEQDNGVSQLAFEIGLSQKQADAVNQHYYKNLLNIAGTAKTRREADTAKAMKSAKDDWGEAHKGNIELAKRVLSEYGDDASKEFLETTGLGNDINILRVFANIGNRLVEDRVMEGSKDGGVSPSGLKDQISTLMANPAYMEKSNPDHNNIVGQVEALYLRLYPDDSKTG